MEYNKIRVKGEMNMEHKISISAAVKNVVQNLIKSEMEEKVLNTPWGFYQPTRPEKNAAKDEK